jgi:O-antigen/teichoic acid export membrane protein
VNDRKQPDETGASAGDSASASRRAGERALTNTALRAGGEIGGKLASLVLFAVLARQVSTASLGTFVFALAWAEVGMTPVGLGIDTYLLRQVAKDRSRVNRMFFNALGLKLVRGTLVLALTVLVVVLLGYGQERALAVCIVTLGMLLDTLARTHMSVFNAYERGDLVATTILVQRFSTAIIGVGVLAAGLGLVAVCAAFAFGGLVRLVLSFVLLARAEGLPAYAFPADSRRELRRKSLAFTTQDIFGLVIARADVLLLAALASDEVVGIYGSAYRLLEATTFIGVSLTGAFSAMYAYLGHDTAPTVAAVFQRSIKLGLMALVPIGVTFAVLAEPLCRALFGEGLVAAAEPLRILAPAVVVWGIVTLSVNLVIAREDPRTMVPVVALAAAANLGFNLALIPLYDENGAALAMLGSTLVYIVPAMTMAVRSVRSVHWTAMLAPPLLAGAVMALPMAVLHDLLPVALAAGTVAYVAAYALLERLLSPDDYEFIITFVKQRLRSGREPAPAP